MITAAGKLVGATGGAGDKAVQFSADCHNGAEDQDYLFFLTEEFRK